jgi:hypothetical protein
LSQDRVLAGQPFGFRGCGVSRRLRGVSLIAIKKVGSNNIERLPACKNKRSIQINLMVFTSTI